jgi:SAM-dependent methyltransferase
MSRAAFRRKFIDRTARKPAGKWARKNYTAPKAHYRSFRIIMEALSLQRDDIYCEIGCGGGVLLRMVMDKVHSGAAIDHSPEMAALAMENNRTAVEAGRLEIVEGDAARLPWEAAAFTACAAANMFFFIPEPEAMLSEVFRVLKPGGRFSMVTIGKGLVGKLTFGWIYDLRTYSNEKMATMLSDTGFSSVSVRSQTMGLYQICYGETPRIPE